MRFAHIVSAILWIGALGFSVTVLGPAISRVGMSARKDTLKQLIPIVGRFIPGTGIATIVFGTLLYLLMGNFDPSILWGTMWGLILFTALLLALGLLGFGLVVVIRASKELLGHLNEETCTHGPEVGALQLTFNRGQVVALVWGFGILALMVVATGAL